jgi:histidinol-phosphate/aromatic aminotransferase/cobyric acid decarboxylase-like protein
MHTFGLEKGSFRVNVGTDEENDAFLAALDRVLQGASGS